MSAPRKIPPRPILKSSSSSASPPPKSPSLAVQFSPCLSTTYLTHASTYYNRSPIQVDANICALPRRDCPSRTSACSTKPQWHIDLDQNPGLSDDDNDSESSSEDSDLPTPVSSSSAFPNFSASSPIALDFALPPSLNLSSRQTYHYDTPYSIPPPSARPSQAHPWDCLGGF